MLSVRLSRNGRPDRLAEKASKRDVQKSEGFLLSDEKKYRLNTLPGEMPERKIFKVNNTALSPEAVAERVVDHFDWPTVG